MNETSPIARLIDIADAIELIRSEMARAIPVPPRSWKPDPKWQTLALTMVDSQFIGEMSLHAVSAGRLEQRFPCAVPALRFRARGAEVSSLA